jgi:hypothetical protein
VNQHDEFERTVARSLRQRTARVAASTPDLDGVLAHVDRRRRRRRHVAAGGSFAMIAVGALGIVSLAAGGSDRVPAPAAASSDRQAAWRCTDRLDHVEEGSSAMFYASCESVVIDGGAQIAELPTPTAPTVGGDTASAPVTTVETGVDGVPPAGSCEEADGDGAPVSIPCAATTTILLPGPPTTEYDPEVDDPVYSADGPNCTPGTGGGIECALIDGEQRYTVEANDSVEGIARRYRLSAERLATYNGWPDGVGHPLLVGDTVLIPPFVGAPVPTIAPIVTAGP